MSAKVYESDYLSVIGEINTYNSHQARPKEYNVNEFLRLYITIQVNGRLRTFSLNFDLAKDENIEDELSLKNWNEWYNVYETLRGMGYNFGDKDFFKGNIISDWIRLLLGFNINK